MLCSDKIHDKINHIHERALRLVYQDYTTSFDDLLKRDGSLTFHHRNIHKVETEMFKGELRGQKSFLFIVLNETLAKN